jgi:hypothetical protein
MKLLYKPFSLLAGLIAARLGRTLFRSIWGRIDSDSAKPPRPTAGDASMSKVVSAAAIEAATMAGVRAAVNRTSARWFHFLTGTWPGAERPRKATRKRAGAATESPSVDGESSPPAAELTPTTEG